MKVNLMKVFPWFKSLLRISKTVPPKTVLHVDLERYSGLWYEIASIPQSFEKGCFGSTATYAPLKDGKISVVNRCYDKSFDGPVREVKGKAWPIDSTNSKLKVQFFWPFTGEYWIVDLGSNYEYSVVSDSQRKTLWILSRTPEMDSEVYNDIVTELKSQGYDVAKLKKTPQLPSCV